MNGHQKTHRFRNITLVIICVCVLIGISTIVALSSMPTLADRLDREIKNSFPVDTPRTIVEQWLQSQPAKYGVYRDIDAKVGHDSVVKLAGLDPDKVGYTVLATYNEKRWLIPYEIDVYFFFNSSDSLLKHWIYEREMIP